MKRDGPPEAITLGRRNPRARGPSAGPRRSECSHTERIPRGRSAYNYTVASENVRRHGTCGLSSPKPVNSFEAFATGLPYNASAPWLRYDGRVASPHYPSYNVIMAGRRESAKPERDARSAAGPILREYKLVGGESLIVDLNELP